MTKNPAPLAVIRTHADPVTQDLLDQQAAARGFVRDEMEAAAEDGFGSDATEAREYLHSMWATRRAANAAPVTAYAVLPGLGWAVPVNLPDAGHTVQHGHLDLMLVKPGRDAAPAAPVKVA